MGIWGIRGSGGGIYFDSKSIGNKLSYTIIENCGNGALTGVPAAIQLAHDSLHTTPQLTLDHTIIQNSYGYGIYSFGGSVVGTNCLINTTGQEAFAAVLGGTYTFTNCTFANYGTSAVTHSNYGTVAILDYYWDGVMGDPTYYDSLNAVMRNCIVYGSLDSEIVCDATGTPAGINPHVTLDHCLLRVGSVWQSFVDTTGCIFNHDPLFKNKSNGDFHLMSGSPAIDAGNSLYKPANDLDNIMRTSNDIGCYQH